MEMTGTVSRRTRLKHQQKEWPKPTARKTNRLEQAARIMTGITVRKTGTTTKRTTGQQNIIRTSCRKRMTRMTGETAKRKKPGAETTKRKKAWSRLEQKQQKEKLIKATGKE